MGRLRCSIWSAAIGRLAVAPDGQTLLCAVDREVLRVDLSAEELGSAPHRVVAQHRGPIRDLWGSPAGDLVASRGDDGQVLVVKISADERPRVPP